MRSGNIVFASAGTVLLVAAVLAPVEWMLYAGAGLIIGALVGPLLDAVAEWEERR